MSRRFAPPPPECARAWCDTCRAMQQITDEDTGERRGRTGSTTVGVEYLACGHTRQYEGEYEPYITGRDGSPLL